MVVTMLKSLLSRVDPTRVATARAHRHTVKDIARYEVAYLTNGVRTVDQFSRQQVHDAVKKAKADITLLSGPESWLAAVVEEHKKCFVAADRADDV